MFVKIHALFLLLLFMCVSARLSFEVWRGFFASVPMLIGFIPVALLLGAQGAQKGLSWLEMPMMTGINFAGGSEFVAVEVWTWPPNVVLIALMTLLINARHLLMGAALVPYLEGVPKRRALPLLFFMCDEVWALSLADAKAQHSRQLSIGFYLGVVLGLYPSWVLFSAIGAAFGAKIGDLTQFGFDMAFPVIFLVLLKGMWKGWRMGLPWGVSLLVAVVVYQLVDGTWYVVAGALSGLIAAALLGRKAV